MKKELRRSLLCVAALLCSMTGWAQQKSTVCNADGTVTFTYKNDNAKEVLVDVQFAGRQPMKRDAQTGLWTATLGPAAPDMYPYCFIVDGVSVMDPLCDQYFPNEGFKNSLLEIPATSGSLAHDIKQVPHGRVEYIHYYSNSLRGTNNAIVYLPPGYMTDRDRYYPVFYLISGTTDTEEVYYKVGRVNYILDNLIAEGVAKEMIVVLPYGNPTKLLPSAGGMFGRMGGQRGGRRGGQRQMGRMPQGGMQGGMQGGFPGGMQGGMQGGFPGGMNGGMQGGFPGGGMPQGGFQGGMPQGGFPGGGMPQGGFPGGMPQGGMPQGGMPSGMAGGMAGGMGAFGGDVFGNDLVNDLMPYIESRYRTINDRDHRAIGGFSRGGNQGLSCGLRNLDKFSYLCSYSSFTSQDIPNVYDNAEDTNGKIRLFWLGVGTDDFLYGTARDYMEFLDKKGIRTVKEFTTDKYGHTWMNAKYFLDKSLRLVFNPKASEEAMKNGKPAPAATGNEQAFTPTVMARLFPTPIVSPQYDRESVTFRFKAPDAKQVMLKTELIDKPLAMEKDTAGVWSVVVKDNALETFEYYFLVDGTQVADPNNMELSPCVGFKPSVCSSPFNNYSLATMGDVEHGSVGYDVERQEAWYMSPMPQRGAVPMFIQLIPGKNQTMESWFKVGGVNAIADKLVAERKTKPCVITTSKMEFMENSDGPRPDFKILTLRADDYKTWAQRRQAFEQLLLSNKK